MDVYPEKRYRKIRKNCFVIGFNKTVDLSALKMKKLILIIHVIVTCMPTAFAGWQQKSSLPTNGRVIPNIFVFGNEAYVAGGFKSGYIYLNENWNKNDGGV